MNEGVPTWVFVAIAGAVGTLLRYGIGGVLARSTGGVFPWETLLINALGSLAIGIIAGLLAKGALLPPPFRMALMVGLIGGFTTFSTFALEAFRLLEDGRWPAAGAYVLLTNLGGLAAVWAGCRAAGG